MKNILAFFGLIFMALLAILGIIMTLIFFNMAGITSQPVTINGVPLRLPTDFPEHFSDLVPGNQPDLGPIQTLVSGGVKIERINPLEGQPVPTISAGPTLTPTPVPPLDPITYRTQVMLKAKDFGSALEAFLSANDKLAKNNALLNDPTWRTEMTTIVEQVSSTGQALAAVGPAPAEYQAIDGWLKRVGPEAQGLRDNYLQAMNSGDTRDFTAASENFSRIKDYLYQAFQEMAKAGWPLQ